MNLLLSQQIFPALILRLVCKRDSLTDSSVTEITCKISNTINAAMVGYFLLINQNLKSTVVTSRIQQEQIIRIRKFKEGRKKNK